MQSHRLWQMALLQKKKKKIGGKMPFREWTEETRLNNMNRSPGHRKVVQASEIANTKTRRWKHGWQGDQGLYEQHIVGNKR